jgi:hypothetical protein
VEETSTEVAAVFTRALDREGLLIPGLAITAAPNAIRVGLRDNGATLNARGDSRDPRRAARRG